MKRRYLFKTTSEEEINISPLIDVVFILLIFFIVTAVFTKETGIDIERPQSMSSREMDTQAMILSVTKEGKVYHEGREIGVRGVRPVVKREMRRQQRPVVIMVDKNASISNYTRVHDEATQAGATSVAMATQP
jgi:biopolymer transport protein ExbD